MSNLEARSFLESVGAFIKSGDEGVAASKTLGIKLATVDPAYVSGLVKVTFDGELNVNSKGFAWNSSYTPKAGDRVYLIPAGNTYIIGGSILTATPAAGPSEAWQVLTLLNAWSPYSGGGNYYSGLRARRQGKSIQIQGMVKSGAVGTIIANFPSTLIPTDSALKLVTAGTAATPRQVAYIITAVGTRGVSANITYDSGPAAPTFVSIDITTPIYEP